MKVEIHNPVPSSDLLMDLASLEVNLMAPVSKPRSSRQILASPSEQTIWTATTYGKS
jgi:hypothetical protein